MVDIDPELRDKIIETHTMIKVVVKDHDEHKRIINARLREVKENFEKHDKRIDKGEHFRTKIITYASIAAVGGAVMMEFIVSAVKKIIGGV